MNTTTPSEAGSVFSVQRSALLARNLSPGFRHGAAEKELFRNLNITLRTGELVCFMGPNGIGKSTLLRTLCGLQNPLSGEVLFFGQRPHKNQFSNVAVVLTDPVSASNMTVYELISFGRYPYLRWDINLSKRDHQIIEEAIELVNVGSIANKKLDELSDGQRQMAIIARAIAQDTPIIILDEPTSHLDLDNRVEIMRLLGGLARNQSKAILVATHELDLALQTADVLWLAQKDKTIVTGIPEDLVLNGALDRVFTFKGYDLKSGRVDQEAHRGISVRLAGDGFEYRWTKNALERSGYFINETSEIEIFIESGLPFRWRLGSGNVCNNLHDLLEELKKIASA